MYLVPRYLIFDNDRPNIISSVASWLNFYGSKKSDIGNINFPVIYDRQFTATEIYYLIGTLLKLFLGNY